MLKYFLFGLLAAFSNGQASVKDCNSGSLFDIQKLSVSPSNPVAGENLTLLLDFNVAAEVNSGTVEYNCIINGLPVWSQSNDLCSQTACPVAVGSHSQESSLAVPEVSGKLICSIKWYNAARENLLCLESSLKLSGKMLRGGNAVYTGFDTDDTTGSTYEDSSSSGIDSSTTGLADTKTKALVPYKPFHVVVVNSDEDVSGYDPSALHFEHQSEKSTSRQRAVDNQTCPVYNPRTGIKIEETLQHY